MNKIIMLTQNNCPKCVVLEEYLKNGLDNKYEEYIERISKEKRSKDFMALARRNGIMATPALIIGESVLINPNSENVLGFLKEHGF